MSYTKTLWKDRVIERPRTYTIQENPDGTVTLIPVTGAVYEPGTPVSAANMNKIEQGIADAHAPLDAATNAATANTIVKRDSAGRFKAAAPAASDDVARKQETDAALTAANTAQSAINTHAARTDNPHATTAAQVGAVNKAGDTMTGTLGVSSGNYGTTAKLWVGDNKYGLGAFNSRLWLVSEYGETHTADQFGNDTGMVWTSDNNGPGKVITLFHAPGEPAAFYGSSPTTSFNRQSGNFIDSGNSINYRILWNSDYATGRNVYLEAVFAAAASGTAYLELFNGSASYGQISASYGSYQRVRSGALNLPDNSELYFRAWSDSGTNAAHVMAVRIIIR